MKKLLLTIVFLLFGFSAYGENIDQEKLLSDIKTIILQNKNEPTFAYGYAYGREDQRNQDLDIIDKIIEKHKKYPVRKAVLQEAKEEMIDVTFSSKTYISQYLKEKLCVK
jgi:hypothetical protein